MAMSKEQDEQATPERWSAKAKTEAILRLFRGESVEAVSREIQVPVHEIETWLLSVARPVRPSIEVVVGARVGSEDGILGSIDRSLVLLQIWP